MGFPIAIKLFRRPTIGRLLKEYWLTFDYAHTTIVYRPIEQFAPSFGVGHLCRENIFIMASLIVESSIVKLIEEVEQRPALYKKSLKEYSDANVKKKLWLEVCEAVVVDWNQLSAEDKTNKGT